MPKVRDLTCQQLYDLCSSYDNCEYGCPLLSVVETSNIPSCPGYIIYYYLNIETDLPLEGEKEGGEVTLEPRIPKLPRRKPL